MRHIFEFVLHLHAPTVCYDGSPRPDTPRHCETNVEDHWMRSPFKIGPFADRRPWAVLVQRVVFSSGVPGAIPGHDILTYLRISRITGQQAAAEKYHGLCGLFFEFGQIGDTTIKDHL